MGVLLELCRRTPTDAMVWLAVDIRDRTIWVYVDEVKCRCSSLFEVIDVPVLGEVQSPIDGPLWPSLHHSRFSSLSHITTATLLI